MTSARLLIDLGAFEENLRAVCERVAPARLMLVVKDDAYAQGLRPVVTRAAASGIDLFGAFDIPTACAVRAAVGEGPTLFAWLTSDEAQIVAALEHGVDLGVGDAEYLRRIGRLAAERGERARVHLKIDTGLHRNGIRPEEWDAVLDEARTLEGQGSIRVVGVWSHIAEASDAEDDISRAIFDEAVAAAEDRGFALELRHLAASAAAFAREEFRYDAVRIGAFCYGVRSAGGPHERALGLVPIATLRARVQRIEGDTAVLDIGWLHGLPSTLAGRMRVRSAQREHAVLRIDADLTVIADAVDMRPGAEVTVFGDGASSATDLAELIGTVGEEILTRVSPLVPREYLRG